VTGDYFFAEVNLLLVDRMPFLTSFTKRLPYH